MAPVAHPGVDDAWLVDRPAGQLRVESRGVEVENPFAEAVGGDGATVVRRTRPIGGTRAGSRALARGLSLSIFTAELFATGSDRDNRAAVPAVGREKLDLVGLALHAPRTVVDTVLKGTTMHP
ncbi:DUF2000 family protein [Micromonospora chokoriensis]|uniref:DUF2000 family protein n=1 Tax=Micromonospora chokoriensis TaxID=356851 RepID=UPI001E3BD615|nr:DUF2000 family protein [Micromonospora chokoriensis]